MSGIETTIADLLKQAYTDNPWVGRIFLPATLMLWLGAALWRSRNADEGALISWGKFQLAPFKHTRQREIAALTTTVDGLACLTDEMTKLKTHLFHSIFAAINGDLSQFYFFFQELANSLTKISSDQNSNKHSAIWVADPAKGELFIFVSNGLTATSKNRRFRRGEGFVGWIWENEISDIVPDVSVDPRFAPPFSPSGDYASVIGMPAINPDGSVIGVLTVQSRQYDAFTEADRAILYSCAVFWGLAFSVFIHMMKAKEEGSTSDSAGSLA